MLAMAMLISRDNVDYIHFLAQHVAFRVLSKSDALIQISDLAVQYKDLTVCSSIFQT